MLPNRDLDPILSVWQAELQYAVEAGVAPQIALGHSDNALTALVGTETLRRLVELRSDVTSPLVAAGGPSGAWLSPLTQPQNGVDARTPSMVTLFTGADAATHISSGATLPLHPTGLRPARERNLPAGYRDLLAPALQPALPLTWESLPWRLLEPHPEAAALPAGPWLGWLALGFSAVLILGALVL